jgi:NitT/TauT family transport system substrate-binding protein
MTLRIGEPYHVVYYAPLHVAYRGGFFEREGLDVELVPSPTFAVSAAALQSGAMDVALGGIMRSLVAYDCDESLVPVHFARVNDRDGFLLLGRTSPPLRMGEGRGEGAFDWPDLLDRRVIVFSEAPTPWQVLRALLLRKGLDPNRVEPLTDVPIGQVADAFRSGMGDFVLTQAHVAEDLLRSGDAVLLRAMAGEAGPLPYSSYYCAPDYLQSATETVRAVARANAAAMRWMRSRTGEEIWEAIRPAFAGGDDETLRAATVRYKSLGVWGSDTTLPFESYDALATAMKAGGLITRVAPYELVIRDQPARDAEAALISSP